MQQTGRPNGDALTVRQLGILAAGALAAGFLNGLLGAGGGVVLYFTLGAIGGARGSKENLVLSSTAVAFYCLVSLYFTGVTPRSTPRTSCAWACPPRSAALRAHICSAASRRAPCGSCLPPWSSSAAC